MTYTGHFVESDNLSRWYKVGQDRHEESGDSGGDFSEGEMHSSEQETVFNESQSLCWCTDFL